jgi:predicted metalloprotease
MRLRGRRGSRNIENRRRQGGGRGGKAAPIGGVGLILVLAIGYFAEEERAAEFSSQILATTEQVWAQIFPRQVGKNFTPPTSVLNADVTQSPCGGASGATDPFYCSADENAYLKTDFFVTLSRQLEAKGDFPATYVIAHEVPHHVQNQLRILGQVHLAHQQSSQTDANALTERLELQADCHSGVWARSLEELLEPSDIEEAPNVARMIGDDQLQKRAGRVPQPPTHGISKQRASWFAKGFSRLTISTSATHSARAGCNV